MKMKKIITLILLCLLVQGVSLGQRVRPTSVRVKPRVTAQHRPHHKNQNRVKHTPPKPHHQRHNRHHNDYHRINNHYYYDHYFHHNNWNLVNNMWFGYWLFATTHGNNKYVINDTEFVVYDIVYDDYYTYSIVHEKRSSHNHLIITNKEDKVLVRQKIKKKYKRIQLVNDFIVLLEKNENPDDIEKYIYDKTQNILYKFDI
jgi:hypothetical protein